MVLYWVHRDKKDTQKFRLKYNELSLKKWVALMCETEH